MSKVKIRLCVLGHIPYLLKLKSVQKRKSELFEISYSDDVYSIVNNSDGEYWEFTDTNIEQQLPKREDEDILIAITNVAIEDNYFARRFTDNRICLSYHEMADILTSSNIPLENLLLRVLYSVSFVYRKYGDKIPQMSELTNFTHDETRGCIFDMNGVKFDIIHSLNKPQLCTSCITSLVDSSPHRIKKNIVEAVQKELKNIKKEKYYQILDFVKKYPFCAFIISSLIALVIGVVGSTLASFIYDITKSK